MVLFPGLNQICSQRREPASVFCLYWRKGYLLNGAIQMTQAGASPPLCDWQHLLCSPSSSQSFKSVGRWTDVQKGEDFPFTLIRAPRTAGNEPVKHIALVYQALPHFSAGSRHPQWRPRGCVVGGPEWGALQTAFMPFLDWNYISHQPSVLLSVVLIQV